MKFLTIASSVALAALSCVAAAPIDMSVFKRADTCPVDVISCSSGSDGASTCCLPKMGQVLLTLQWYNGLGPSDEFTIHGLWPNTCSGGQGPSTGCDPNRVYTDIETRLKNYPGAPSSLISDLNTYWASYKNDNNAFWAHEWNKHGTCLSTLEPGCFDNFVANHDLFSYFTKVLELRKQYNLYKVLADKGITPGSNPSVKDMQAAFREAFGFPAQINCKSGALSE
ncbi:ribonuclease T2-like, partial [Lunasporangiospora selenospora]